MSEIQATDAQIEAAIETSFKQGSKTAWLHMLAIVLHALERDTPVWTIARMVVEREMAVKALRSVCDDHGDNDWSDDLNLYDIIEKHLARHLSDGC